MLLRADRGGGIREMDPSTWMTAEVLDDTGSEEEDLYDRIRSGKEISNKVLISCSDGALRWIALPAYYRGDLFLLKDGDGVCLSDDLFELCCLAGRITVDSEMMAFFKIRGFCPVGKTMFREIARLRPDGLYRFRDGSLVREDYETAARPLGPEDDEEAYRIFKETLGRSIDRDLTEKNCVLLSGGVDSRLMYLLLKERTEQVPLVTCRMEPGFMENILDVWRAEQVAGLTGNPIRVVTHDMGKARFDELLPVIRRNPLSVHASLHYLAMFREAAKVPGVTVWSGQNMDTLYNLGPTERPSLSFHGVAQWYKRSYLSEEYFRTLDGVEGKGALKDRIIAEVGLRLFRRTTGDRRLTLPKSPGELVGNFASAVDYTVFGGRGASPHTIETPISTFGLKRGLYREKIAFLKGGDPQAIEAGAYFQGARAVLPYSSQEMVRFFDRLRLTRRDVWSPKRFSYRYLKEFVPKYGRGIASFRSPSRAEISRKYGEMPPDLYQSFQRVIDETGFGQGLRERAREEPSGYTSLQRYDSLLKLSWACTIQEILREDLGVTVVS